MEEESGGTPNPLNPNTQDTGLNVVEAFMAKMNSSNSSAHPVDPAPTNVEEPKPEAPTEETPKPEEPIKEAPVEETKTIQVEVVRENKPPIQRAGVMDMVRPTNVAKPVSPSQIPVGSPIQPQIQPQTPVVNTDSMETLGIVTDMEGSAVTEEMFDPAANRPMEKAPASVVVKPKRKKVGLIIGMIASLFVAIACGVVAILMLNHENSEDSVAMAMDKLISENAEKNAAIDGTINIVVNDATSQFSNFTINVNSQMIVKTVMNSTTATLNANLKNGESFSVKFDGLYASGDELYLKVEGAPSLAGILNSSDEEKAILETINNVWLKISLNDFKLLRPDDIAKSNLECTMDWISGVNNNINRLKRLYNSNPFVTSTNEDIAVSSVNHPVRKFMIDEDNFNIFLNGAYEINLLNDSTTCKNNKQDEEFNISDVIETVKKLPDVYLEVDENYNFTRIYSTFDTNDSKATVTIDLNLTHPKVINISEPIEFKVFSVILQGDEATEEAGATEGAEAATEK